MNLDWPGLARRRQTVVIYMGLSGLSHLCAKLMEHGLPADWPAAIVQHGTQPTQRTITGTLTTLPALAEAANLRAPTLIIVGEVVTLRDKLRWFEESLD
jgi:siroheme synthase